MHFRCSSCGQSYPPDFSTSTCRICGGEIERAELSKNIREDAVYEERWHEWRHMMLSAPPRPLKEDDWINVCGVFNGCAICGCETIEEKLLVVPTHLQGKLYTYNVIPACYKCAKRYRQSVTNNPIKSLYTLKGHELDRIDKIINYLEADMLGAVYEEFDFEHDSLEIIVKVTEDTSIRPFDGIVAKRIFSAPARPIIARGLQFEGAEYATQEAAYGVTWRLLDD